jgi:hypothetical protein
LACSSVIKKIILLFVCLILMSMNSFAIDLEPFIRDHQGQIMLDFAERYESDQGTHLSEGVFIRTPGPVMINSPVSGRVIFYGSENVIPPEVFVEGNSLYQNQLRIPMFIVETAIGEGIIFYNVESAELQSGDMVLAGDPLGTVLDTEYPGFHAFQISAFTIVHYGSELSVEDMAGFFWPDTFEISAHEHKGDMVIFSPEHLGDHQRDDM